VESFSLSGISIRISPQFRLADRFSPQPGTLAIWSRQVSLLVGRHVRKHGEKRSQRPTPRSPKIAGRVGLDVDSFCLMHGIVVVDCNFLFPLCELVLEGFRFERVTT